MKNNQEIKKIKCAIFRSKNETILKITEAINQEIDIKAKARLALNLIKETEGLIKCDSFNQKHLECQICRKIANLRISTANLIIEAAKLESRK